MTELFNYYKDKGQMEEAILVGHSLLNRNPANREIFSQYFDYLCFLADNLPMLSEQESMAAQAKVALMFFSENAELDEETVCEIQECSKRLDNIFESLKEEEKTRIEKASDEIKRNNRENIKKMYQLKDIIIQSTSQEDFDKLLSKLNEIDQEINKDMLSAEESQSYDTLTKVYTDTISEKMREFEQKRNVDYNKRAVGDFEKAFQQFRQDEAKYKNQTQLHNLASKYLFAYDASRLSNETLIYYNHVYSYIFSRLDDDGKFALTKFSIECERKLR